VGVDGRCPDCGEPLEPTPGVDHQPSARHLSERGSAATRIQGDDDNVDDRHGPMSQQQSSRRPGGAAAPVAGPPWHFWLGVTAAGIYLLWRAVQGVVWLF